jgi:uncharacterized membrane protein
MIKKYIVFASIGFELVGLIIGCYYLAEMLDKKFQSHGMIFVGLSLTSLVGWLVRVIWLLQRIQDKDDDKN